MRLLVLVASLLLVLVDDAADAQPIITSITPSSGSMAGGTLVTISGQGFSLDKYVTADQVYLGNVSCSLETHATSSQVLTCITPTMPVAGSYPLTVSVGPYSTTFNSFVFTPDYTPTIYRVVPLAGPPTGLPTLVGDATWHQQVSCVASALGSAACVQSIAFGQLLCSVSPYNPAAFFAYPAAPVIALRYGYSKYSLNCTLPLPDVNPLTPEVNVAVAGYYNTTVGFGGDMYGGQPTILQSAYFPDQNGNAYMYEIYPVVTSVVPPIGSQAGGTLMNISGSGFPDSSVVPNINAVVSATIGTMPCTIVTSNFTVMQCRTSKQPINGVPTPVSFNGWYPGMRGIEYTYYPSNSTAQTFSRLTALEGWAAAGTFAQNAGTPFIIQDLWDTPNYTVPYYCGTSRAIFTAPRSAVYTFMMNADDFARLNASYYVNSVYITTNLINEYNWLSPDNWDQGSAQRAVPLGLTAGQQVLLSASHCNNAASGNLQVGVLVSNPQAAFNSFAAVQSVTVVNQNWGHVTRLQYLHTSPNVTAVDVVISASTPQQLASPNIAVSLVVNNITVSAPLLLTSTAATVASAVAAALNLTSAVVSVEMSSATNSLTWRIAVATGSLQLTSSTPLLAVTATLLPLIPVSSPPTSSSSTNGTCTPSQATWTPTVVAAQPPSPPPPSPAPPQLPPPLQPPSTPSPPGYGGSNATAYNVTSTGMIYMMPASPGIYGNNSVVYLPSYTSVPFTSTTSVSGSSASSVGTYDLTGMAIAVNAVALGASGAIPPGSSWRIFSTDQYNFTSLPFNASNSAVLAAVQVYTGYGVTVNSSSVTVGAKTGTAWDVTFPWSVSDAVPVLNVMLETSSPSYAFVASAPFQSASAPVLGSMMLAFGSSCNAVNISLTDSATSMAGKLNTLPGLSGVTVTLTGGNATGYIVTVQFDARSNPGVLPLLQIVATNITGSVWTATVAIVRNGSTDWLYAPIPADMLSVPTRVNNSVQISVNGVPATCLNNTACAFSYDFSVTPWIRNAAAGLNIGTTGTANDTAYNGAITQTLIITGVNFIPDYTQAVVFIGSVPCIPTQATLTTVMCTFSQLGWSTGYQLVSLNFPLYGNLINSTYIYFKGLVLAVEAGTGLAQYTNPTLSPNALSPFNFTGRGFNAANCSANIITMNSQPAPVINCSASWIYVFFPGGAVMTSMTVNVTLYFYNGTIIDSAQITTPWSTTRGAQVVATALSISGITSQTTNLPTAGANSISFIKGATVQPAAVKNILGGLIPSFPAGVNQTFDSNVLNASMAGFIPCQTMTAIDTSTQATCNPGVVPPGSYFLFLSFSTYRYVFPQAITFSFYVSQVRPSYGSIGGGTMMTISGAGFSTDITALVVMLTVPVSSTFSNGVVPCDVLAATPSAITCRTRPYLIATATSSDPNAALVQPASAPSSAISLVYCPANFTAVQQLDCWADTTVSRARASCTAANPADCQFSYFWGSTPNITTVSPQYGSVGTVIQVVGVFFDGVVSVSLINTATNVSVACPIILINSTYASCTAPDQSAGLFQVVLSKSTGELSVDMNAVAYFFYVASITAVSGIGGSVMGGGLLTLGAGGAGFNDVTPTANQITIAGQACVVVSASRYSVTCQAPPINSLVYAEYWAMPIGTSFLPDLTNYASPDLVRYETSLNINWNTLPNTIPPGLQQLTYWVARFTTYLQVPVSGTYSFYLQSDDDAHLLFDGVLLGDRWTPLSIYLTQGYHLLEIHYLQMAGGAYFYLQWDAGLGWGSTSPSQGPIVPPTSLFVTEPGYAVPIVVTVNAVPVLGSCPPATVVLPPGSSALLYELMVLSTVQDECAYFYSTYLTPVFSSLSAGVTTVTAAGALLNGTGVRLPPSVSSYNITMGGQACVITSLVSPYQTVVSPVVGSGNGTNTTQQYTSTNVSMNFNAAYNGSFVCALPALPAGPNPVQVYVSGMGFAQLPGVTLTATINYGLAITSIYPALGSALGGTNITVLGYGFTPSTTALVLGRTMTVNSMTSPFTGLNFSVNFANATLIQATLQPFRALSLPLASANMALRVRVIPPAGSAPSSFSMSAVYTLDATATPAVSAITPVTLLPWTAATLQVGWSVARGSNTAQTVAATTKNSVSNATVSLKCGTNSFSCLNPNVSSSTLAGQSYAESFSCTVPAMLPSANYSVWVCLPPFGCGYSSSNVSINMTVTSATPLTGSSLGGLSVTITGTGFSTDITQVAVRFGTSPCVVIAATATSVVCVTGVMPSAGYGTYSLYVTPSGGAAEQLMSTSYSFVYAAALTPGISSVLPYRGSTAGGTVIVVQGTGFSTTVAQNTIMVGATVCKVTKATATALTCTTGAPTKPTPLTPQAVLVTVTTKGLAVALPVVQYQYIDLWSRKTTWGGSSPPVDGDTVYIPVGTSVMLDVSSPMLNLLIVEGNLCLDSTSPVALALNARYILMVGGNLTVGTTATPWPANLTATITLSGTPQSIELPLYGAKVLALRQGMLSLVGAPKTPAWTQLNVTANPNDSSITVKESVNWAIGDTIVIASSSFFAEEVDTAVIANITSNGDGTTQLLLASPLMYTHLGVIRAVVGDPQNHMLDMRAEVAVLTRNIVFQGDAASAQSLFGAAIMVSTPSTSATAILQLQDVEMTMVGQAHNLGMYPVGMHLQGDLGYASFVTNCAIHVSYNRAVALQGTSSMIIQSNVVFNIMGHAFYLEDGTEVGNVLQNNLGILTRTSSAQLYTDLNPATFWIAHPNNTLIGNRAAGSQGHGFWYNLQASPAGASASASALANICPQFQPFGLWQNNVAHSNLLYGLQLFPAYYPKINPCSYIYGSYNQVPATFNGMTAYKNGLKGASATQVGLVQFANFTVADCGGGPLDENVGTGKNQGAAVEFVVVRDNRNRASTPPSQMAGLLNSVLVATTPEGQTGSLAWTTARQLRGAMTQSAPMGDSFHSALLTLLNVTFSGYDGGISGSSPVALEPCARCLVSAGGATTVTAGVTLVQPSGAAPVLAQYSWPHQGIYQDRDGSMLTPGNLGASYAAQANGWSLGAANATLHAALGNPFTTNNATCIDSTPSNGSYGVCSPSVLFRRFVVDSVYPGNIHSSPLLLTDLATNTTLKVPFSQSNENGFMLTAPTQRTYWMQWQSQARVDSSQYYVQRADLLDVSTGWMYLQSRYVTLQDHITVNYVTPAARTTLPPSNSSHGSSFYNATMGGDSTPAGTGVAGSASGGWAWSGLTYNDTRFTMLLNGAADGSLLVNPQLCPDVGCNEAPPVAVNVRPGVLYWSAGATWASSGATASGAAPVAGDNVTIPAGWTLVIDVSTPILNALIIEGSLTIGTASYVGGDPLQLGNLKVPDAYRSTLRSANPSRNADGNYADVASTYKNRTTLGAGVITGTPNNITISAAYIIIRNSGSLTVGSAAAPSADNVTFALSGNRSSTPWLVSNASALGASLGAKVIAVYRGGRLDLHGAPVPARWARLLATANAGDTTVRVDAAGWGLAGWVPNAAILLASTTYNPRQAETAIIQSVSAAGVITLTAPLQFTHAAKILAYANSSLVLDMRGEVALLTSNIVVTSSDAATQYSSAGGQKFGVRVVVSGPSVASISDVQFAYCGQAGIGACIEFDGLQPVLAYNGTLPNTTLAWVASAPNPSYVVRSVISSAMDAAINVRGGASTPSPAGAPAGPAGVLLDGNVMSEQYGAPAVLLTGGGGSQMTGNLALSTLLVSGTSVPSTYTVQSAVGNTIKYNVAAGSERYGWKLTGTACDAASAALIADNSAHSSLVGLLLKATDAVGSSCTALTGFTAYLTWDFGVTTPGGIASNVSLTNVSATDSKHAGVLMLVTSAMTYPAAVTMQGGILAGRTSPDVCTFCNVLNLGGRDPGCHPKLASYSYNRYSPFSPSVGLYSSSFALSFVGASVAGESAPYDEPTNFPIIQGSMTVSNVTLASFAGYASCTGPLSGGTFALGNHYKMPDAFHPHFFSAMQRVNTTVSGGLLLSAMPDPAWQTVSSCGAQNTTLPDGSTLTLNCAGPRHTYFRDLDGGLTANASTLLGSYGAVRSTTLWDQGTPVIPGPCSFSASGAYTCVPGVQTSSLVGFTAPTPAPPRGLFGDPQLFVLESRDTDSQTRNFGPVMLQVGTVVDLLVPTANYAWCFTAACVARLSTFWGYAPTGVPAAISFTGTPPQTLRLWLPYADTSAELVFTINMQGSPYRRYVWSAAAGRIAPLLAVPVVGDGTPGGSCYWNQQAGLLTVKIVGQQSLELRQESAVQVTQTLGLTIDQFYDTKALFLSNLAYILGIQVSRIRIVTIIAGSVVLDMQIVEDPALSNAVREEAVFDILENGVSPSVAALASALSPAARDALFATLYPVTTPTTTPTPTVNGTASGNSTNSTTGAAAPSAEQASVDELVQIYQQLQQSYADGTLAARLGVPILEFSVASVNLATTPTLPIVIVTSSTPAPPPGAASSVPPPPPTAAALQPGQSAPPTVTATTNRPPPSSPTLAAVISGGGAKSVIVFIVPAVVGVAVIGALLAAFVLVRKRRRAAAAAAGDSPDAKELKTNKSDDSNTSVAPLVAPDGGANASHDHHPDHESGSEDGDTFAAAGGAARAPSRSAWPAFISAGAENARSFLKSFSQRARGDHVEETPTILEEVDDDIRMSAQRPSARLSAKAPASASGSGDTPTVTARALSLSGNSATRLLVPSRASSPPAGGVHAWGDAPTPSEGSWTAGTTRASASFTIPASAPSSALLPTTTLSGAAAAVVAASASGGGGSGTSTPRGRSLRRISVTDLANDGSVKAASEAGESLKERISERLSVNSSSNRVVPVDFALSPSAGPPLAPSTPTASPPAASGAMGSISRFMAGLAGASPNSSPTAADVDARAAADHHMTVAARTASTITDIRPRVGLGARPPPMVDGPSATGRSAASARRHSYTGPVLPAGAPANTPPANIPAILAIPFRTNSVSAPGFKSLSRAMPAAHVVGATAAGVGAALATANSNWSQIGSPTGSHAGSPHARGEPIHPTKAHPTDYAPAGGAPPPPPPLVASGSFFTLSPRAAPAAAPIDVMSPSALKARRPSIFTTGGGSSAHDGDSGASSPVSRPLAGPTSPKDEARLF